MFIKVNMPAIDLFYGPVYYHESKVQQGEAERLDDLTYETSPTAKAKYLYQVTSQNTRVTTNRGFDIAVAFHPDENLSNEEMNVLAKEVLTGLKFNQCPYVVYRHNDKPHSHFHIVVTSVDINGMKIPEHRLFNRAKELAVKLEQKYSLRQTERRDSPQLQPDYMVEHYGIARAAVKYNGETVLKNIAVADLYDKSFSQLKNEYGMETVNELKVFFAEHGLFQKSERQQLFEKLQSYRQSTFSYEGFEKSLLADGFYIRKVANDRIIYKLPEGNYYFDDKTIARQFQYQELSEYYDRSRGAGKRSLIDQQLKIDVNTLLKKEKSIEAFVIACFEKGIKVEFATYSDGRAYGVSFSNLKTGEIFKGSQLGLSLDKILRRYNPTLGKNKPQPFFYPGEMKKAKRMASKLGYLLSQTEEDQRKEKQKDR